IRTAKKDEVTMKVCLFAFILDISQVSDLSSRMTAVEDTVSGLTRELSELKKMVSNSPTHDPPFPEDEKLLSDMFFSWEKSTVYISGSSQFMNKEVRLQGASAVEDYSLLKHLSEEAKDMVKRTDPKKPDDCRRLFMLIDRTPPEGYERGIRWLESYVAQRAKEHPKYSK
ncbi:hypothetical protein FOL47_007080, partial [Perkinsus chesapeaki]